VHQETLPIDFFFVHEGVEALLLSFGCADWEFVVKQSVN